MTTVLRETTLYSYVRDVNGHTRFQMNRTGRLTNWNTGYDAEQERKQIEDMEDWDFDEYCKTLAFNK